MATAVTNTTIAKYNTITAVSSTAATADTDALAEVFTITPTEGTESLLIEIGGTGSSADGNITASFAAGALWAGKALGSLTITKNTTKIIQVETAQFTSATGTISLTLTPASSDKLLTDHAAFVKVYELR